MKADLKLATFVPDAWNKILLVEDNSARAHRRLAIGVASPSDDTQVTVGLHRISASGCKVVAERSYRADSLRERAGDGLQS